jgi:hypothetical protein
MMELRINTAKGDQTLKIADHFARERRGTRPGKSPSPSGMGHRSSMGAGLAQFPLLACLLGYYNTHLMGLAREWRRENTQGIAV